MQIRGFKKDYKKPLLYLPCLPCKECYLNFLPIAHGQKLCISCLKQNGQLHFIKRFSLRLKREDIIHDIEITWEGDELHENIEQLLKFANESFLKQDWYTIVTD